MSATKSHPVENETGPTPTVQNTSLKKSAIVRKPVSKKAESKTLLVKEISSRMEVIPDTPGCKEDVVDPYTESWKILKAMRDEVQQIIPALCKATLTYRQSKAGISGAVRDKALTTALREMEAAISIDIPPPENFCDAHVLRLDADELGDFLRGAVHSHICDFVDRFFATLDELVDQNVAGLAIWTSPTTLQYSFVRQIVEQTVTAKETKTERKVSETSSNVVVNRTETKESGTTTRTIARFDHHVFDASETTIEESTAVIPAVVQTYIDSVPDWLQPVLCIIDGTLAKQEVTEKTLRNDQWDETTVVREERRVIKEIVVARDPALVIGDVVLIGWDADDIQRELNRRRSLDDKERRAREKKAAETPSFLWGAATVIAGLTSLFLFCRATSQPQLFAAFSSLLLVIPSCIFHTTFLDRTRASSFNTKHVRVALIVVCGLLAFGLLFAFGLSRWSVIGTSVGLWALAGALGLSIEFSDSQSTAS